LILKISANSLCLNDVLGTEVPTDKIFAFIYSLNQNSYFYKEGTARACRTFLVSFCYYCLSIKVA
jgi:hypothetical protein